MTRLPVSLVCSYAYPPTTIIAKRIHVLARYMNHACVGAQSVWPDFPMVGNLEMRFIASRALKEGSEATWAYGPAFLAAGVLGVTIALVMVASPRERTLPALVVPEPAE
jgi:hypothetical protein